MAPCPACRAGISSSSPLTSWGWLGRRTVLRGWEILGGVRSHSADGRDACAQCAQDATVALWKPVASTPTRFMPDEVIE